MLFLIFFGVTSASTSAGSDVTSASTSAGSGVTSTSTSAGSGVTSASTSAGSDSSICSAKNAELSSDSGFVSTTGFALVSVNAGFSSWSIPSSWGIWPKLSDVTLLSSILM